MEVSLDAFKTLPVWQASLIGLGGILVLLAGYRFLVTFSHLYAAALFGLGGLLIGGATGVSWLPIALGVFLGVVGFALGRAYLWLNLVATGVLGGAAFGFWAGQLAGLPKSVWPAAIGAGVCGALSIYLQRHLLVLATSALGAVATGIGVMVCVNSIGLFPVESHAIVYLGLIAALFVAGAAAQYRTSQEISDQYRRLVEARKQRMDKA
ncbi:MAG TPA: hypothetical protein VI643_00345 [Planctomycetota bacterium]|nr:hypothetical protein [Planctomycetota bacterium]